MAGKPMNFVRVVENGGIIGFLIWRKKRKKEGHDSRSFDGNGEKVNDAFWGVVENFSPVILITGILHQSPRGLSWHA